MRTSGVLPISSVTLLAMLMMVLLSGFAKRWKKGRTRKKSIVLSVQFISRIDGNQGLNFHIDSSTVNKSLTRRGLQKISNSGYVRSEALSIPLP